VAFQLFSVKSAFSIMKKFVGALLIVSMLALACKADHQHHDHQHEDKTKVEKSPVKKAVEDLKDLKDLKKEHRSIAVNKVPPKKRQPQVRARNYKLKNTVRNGPPKVNLKKLPIPPPRKSRRISPSLKKPLNKPHHPYRRVLKKVRGGSPKVHHHQKVAHVQHKRPAPAGRVNNFSRFLRAFGRQLNRPVLPRFVAKQPQVQTRRKFKIPKGIVHPLVFTKAESIAGYEKFTLDEVIYPGKTEEKQVEAKERSDDVSEEDIVVVDTTELKKDDSAVSSNSKAKKVDVR